MYTYQWAYIYTCIHMDKTQHCLSHVYHVLFSILFCPCKHFVLWWFSCTIEVYQILYFVWITSVIWIWVVRNSWSRMTLKIISIQNMAQIVCTQNKAAEKKCQCMIIAKLQSIYLPVINLFPWDLTLEQLASMLYWYDTLGKAVRDKNSYNWIFYSIMNTFLWVRFVYIFSGMQWCTLYSGSWLMLGQDSSVGVPSSLPLVKECLIATGT